MKRYSAPSLVAIRWRDEAEVLAMANDSHYDWRPTSSPATIGAAMRATQALEAGWIQVNRAGGQIPGMSYGGAEAERHRRRVLDRGAPSRATRAARASPSASESLCDDDTSAFPRRLVRQAVAGTGPDRRPDRPIDDGGDPPADGRSAARDRRHRCTRSVARTRGHRCRWPRPPRSPSACRPGEPC